MLDKQQILKRTGNGLFVFRHYIGNEWRVGKSFRNPLYDDTNPSCTVYHDKKSNTYKMKDFGNDEYSGDCFYIVGKITGYDCTLPNEFIEILKTINRDMNLGIADEKSSRLNQNPNTRKVGNIPNTQNETIYPDPQEQALVTDKKFHFTSKQFTESELAFWASYGIKEDILVRYNVESILEFRSKTQAGKIFWFSSSRDEPSFGYINEGYIKLYRPFSAMRFCYGGNVPDNHCFGLNQLPAKGDILFITGGEKDVMSLAARGFNAICFNSETANIPTAAIQRLTYRFKHIVLLYDTDKTGLDSSKKHTQQLAEYNVMRLLLPLEGTKEQKDISDYFRLGHSESNLRYLFTSMLCKRYSNTISILNSCKIALDQPPPESKVIVSINDVPLGTNGNLLCITGGEGSGKSNFVGALIAGAINTTNKDIDTLGVKIKATDKQKPILLYDTEQSAPQVHKNSLNITRRAARVDLVEEFKPYSFASISRDARLVSIIESMDLFYHQNRGIHLVVIDGVADLVSGANNENESVAVIEQLYRLAAIYNTCIICVLHFIPNGLKLRGHLGSELQRKAAAILSIEREGSSGTSLIKALKVRDGSPLDVPIMQFAWNKEQAMHTYLGEKPKEERDKRKREELQDAANVIFAQTPHLTYNELSEKLQAYFEVQDRAAKKYIKFMRENEIVINDPSSSSYLMIGLNQK